MMNFIKKYKFIVLASACAVVVLTVAFFAGGSLSSSPETAQKSQIKSATSDTAVVVSQQASTMAPSTKADDKNKVQGTSAQTATEKNSSKSTTAQTATVKNSSSEKVENTTSATTKKDKYQTDEIPQGKPTPVEPQEQETKDNTLKCTFSISCATIFDNMDMLKPSKVDFVPSDGWILKPVTVTFNEGESVYDVFLRVCQQKKLQYEFVFTPIYNSNYIKGINNIYEYDCGGGSGWNYSVNSWFPNYGCSRYQLNNGDVIEFKYTCNYGADTGALGSIGE